MTGFISQETFFIEPGLSLSPSDSFQNKSPLAIKVSEATERALDVTPKASPSSERTFTFEKPTGAGSVTALHRACEGNGDLARIRELLETESGRKMVNSLDGQLTSPLYYLVASSGGLSLNKRRERFEMVELLLKHGANPNQGDQLQMTPLMLALQYNWKEGVELLLRYRADISKPTSDGKTPLMQTVLDSQDDMTFLLLKSGADVNAQDSLGESALSIACRQNQTAQVELLLENGAKPDKGLSHFKKSLHALPPLHVACQAKNLEVVQLLIQAGADVNLSVEKDGEVYTPFACACTKLGNDIIIQHLIKSGARAEILSEKGELYCAIAQRPQYVKYLKSAKDERALSGKKLALSNSVENREGLATPYESWHAPIFYQDFAEAIQESAIEEPVLKKNLADAFLKASNKKPDAALVAADIRAGKLVILATGWKGHAISVVFYGKYFAVVNRGEGSDGHSNAEFYPMDRSLAQEKLVEVIMQTRKKFTKDEGVSFYYDQLPYSLSPRGDGEVVKDEFCITAENQFALSSQEVGNCPQASAEGAIPVALALLVSTHKKSSCSLSLDEVAQIKQISKEIALKKRLDYLESYLASHETEDAPKIDSYLIRHAWARIKADLKRCAVSLRFHPRVRSHFWEPEISSFRHRATTLFRGSIARLRTGSEAVLERVFSPLLATISNA